MSIVFRTSGSGSDCLDLRVEGRRITEVGRGLRRVPGEMEINARAGAVLPGLHDHHLHLMAQLGARRSVAVGPDAVVTRLEMTHALREAANVAPSGGWIRAVGYHPSVAGDLDRHVLDRMVADHPVRVQHRSGSLWVLNSAALDKLGGELPWLDGVERDNNGRPTGRLWRLDRWLADRLGPAMERSVHGDLGELSAAGLSLGVTGWTDATPERSPAQTDILLTAASGGAIRQRLHLMMPGDPAAWPTDSAGVEGLTAGPVKIMLDDWDLPGFDALARRASDAHVRGRAVAVHCVTRVQLALTVATLERVGHLQGDRIEHGALISPDWFPALAASGVIVVTQPNFVAERGDHYRAEVSKQDQVDLWRAGSLVDAGVAVAAGSDAPFGSPDPWVAIRAAMRRRTPSGASLGADEVVTAEVALGWWTGWAAYPQRPRRLEPGAPADIVVLDEPLGIALRGDDPVSVRMTMLDGEIVSGA